METALLINGFPVRARFSERTIDSVLVPFLRQIAALHRKSGTRQIVFLAAPPGADKTTLAAFLETFAVHLPGMPSLQALGMDGFHFSRKELAEKTIWRAGEQIPMQRVKGAPETFNAAALRDTLTGLRSQDGLWPAYDRRLHDTVPDALRVTADILLVEGNYLLLDAPVWRDLPHDYAVFLRAEEEQVRERLIARKIQGGASEQAAQAFYDFCDGPNVRLCLSNRMPGDEVWQLNGAGEIARC